MTLSTRVADDQLGQYFRRTSAIADRLGKSLSFDKVMDALQRIHDGKFDTNGVGAIAPTPEKPKLLEDVSTFSLADQSALVARDCFKKDTSKKASPRISYLGDNFTAWFLGKTEEAVAAMELSIRRLTENSRDDRILAELGGLEETTLSQFLALLILQGNGEKDGALLVNGYANIFYIKDVNGALRAVVAPWLGDGWILGAHPVAYPDGWRAGGRVVSRK